MQAEKTLPQELVEQFVIAAHGDEEKVRELHAHEPYLVNAAWEKFDETGLQAASHMGNRGIARYLISQGAHPDICSAAMLGDGEQVASYLKSDPSQANAKGAHGIPVMFHAALSGNTEVAELLLSNGGGEGIDHALHAAVSFGHLDMVKWLLERGVQNVNVLNFENKTPLEVATAGGHTEIAELLRQHGATG